MKRILVTGGHGFLGRYVVHVLSEKYEEVDAPTHVQLDLSHTSEFLEYVRDSSPALIVHLAAHVAGISANLASPYTYLNENVRMAQSVSDAALYYGVPVLAAGSICMYPEYARIPFVETELWHGEVEPSNLGYGEAKRFLLTSLTCVQRQRGVRYGMLISANLYGPGDDFGPDAHVIPSLIKRIANARDVQAETVTVWGDGTPTRDFLHVQDAAHVYARAVDYLLTGRKSFVCNVGSGYGRSIRETAYYICAALGYKGELIFDRSKPNGQLRRQVNYDRARSILDWKPTVDFQLGIKQTVDWYLEHVHAGDRHNVE